MSVTEHDGAAGSAGICSPSALNTWKRKDNPDKKLTYPIAKQLCVLVLRLGPAQS